MKGKFKTKVKKSAGDKTSVLVQKCPERIPGDSKASAQI